MWDAFEEGWRDGGGLCKAEEGGLVASEVGTMPDPFEKLKAETEEERIRAGYFRVGLILGVVIGVIVSAALFCRW